MNEMIPTAALTQAEKLAGLGDLPGAERLLQQCVENYPAYAEGLYRLGLMRMRQQAPAAAIELLERACDADGREHRYQNDLGIALAYSGQLERAAQSFEHALRLDPNSADSWNNLGLALSRLNRLEDALSALQNAAQLRPTFFEALNNLGNVLHMLGRVEEALTAYQSATKLNPSYFSTLRNQGLCLSRLRRYAEQAELARQIIQLAPGQPDGHFQLGSALLESGFAGEALQSFAHLQTICPMDTLLANSLARAHLESGSPDQAEAYYRTALSTDPQNLPAKVGLILSAERSGHWAVSRQRLSQTLPEITDRAYAAEVLGRALFFSQADPDITAEARFKLHQSFGNLYQAETPFYDSSIPRDPDKKLRIAFLSPDFRSHSVATFFLPVLDAFDRSQMEFVGFFTGAHTDAATEQIRRAFDQWKDARHWSDMQLAENIRNSCVDILIDLSLHTAGNRALVLAMKPAPIQATWLGYSGTTGMTNVDYHISDQHMNPIGLTDAVFTERIFRLRGSAVVFQPTDALPPVTRKDSGAPFTFASLSQLFKLNTDVAQVWSAIMNQTVSARLMIGNVNTAWERQYVEGLFRPWLERIDSLQMLPKLGFNEYLALHNEIDVALDTFPYGGGTTTGYALAMGVPVLTLDEPVPNPRMPGISLLRNADLEEFIAPSRKAYVSKAVALEADRARLRATRDAIRTRFKNAELNRPERLARALQEALRTMWREYCLVKSL